MTESMRARNEAFAQFALDAAHEAGVAILPHFRAAIDVEDKGGTRGYDPVTEADRAAEAVIRAAIARRYPDHGIEGEEHGRVAGRTPFTWVIDPIDGTRSFILGHLHWATLIALHDGHRPIVGVTHQPFVGETFVALNDVSEWRRGDEQRRLRTRACRRMADAVVVPGGMFGGGRHRRLAGNPRSDGPTLTARTEQCHDLLDNEVAGIHFYTLNRSDATRVIFDSLGIPRRRKEQAQPA